jgi:pSer/pThr/pTyr-binding forkhead associated (FHA) protein
MPLIRCPRCGQSYDIPPAVAVRLPSSIATCDCGEWLAGSKAALLAGLGRNSEDVTPTIDLKPYRVEPPAPGPPVRHKTLEIEPFDLSTPRSLRVIARGGTRLIDSVFSIHRDPLWIGRKGCHVDIEDAELSIRHCSISLVDGDLLLRDAHSYTGTFLDGQRVIEAVIGDGVHLLRVGSALISLEPAAGPGESVGAVTLDEDELEGTAAPLRQRMADKAAKAADASERKRAFLVCVGGALEGQEFEIPFSGLVVGREGDVRVLDEFLSRRHFSVQRDSQGAIRVRDLGSRNGTFLNTLPARDTKVHGGDEIRAGVNRFRVEER